MLLISRLEIEKQEFSMVKQKKIALETFDDKSCYRDKYTNVPGGYIPSS